MPHLLAYKGDYGYSHLARWNRETTAAARHLGSGKAVFSLPKTDSRFFAFGEYVTKPGSTEIAVATGYTGAWTLAGEKDVAASLYSHVESGNTAWPYVQNEWTAPRVDAIPFWYASGGVGISQESYVASRSEAAMMLCARKFSLPQNILELVQAGVGISARVLVRGIGAWVQPNFRESSIDINCDIPTIEGNPNYFGGTGSSAYTRRIMFETYQDSLSIGVHCVCSDTLTKAIFSPMQCFFVRSVCPTCGAVSWWDLRRLTQSHDANNSAQLDVDTLRTYYGIDMDDACNSHWLGWAWRPSRSVQTSGAERFAEQTWALNHGGTLAAQAVFTETGGTGWGAPYITGAQWNPHDGSTPLFMDFSLAQPQLDHLAAGGSVWLMASQLPMFSSTGYARGDFSSHYTQRTKLPSSARTFEHGPCVNTMGTATNLQGKQMCNVVLSVADVALEVTLG